MVAIKRWELPDRLRIFAVGHARPGSGYERALAEVPARLPARFDVTLVTMPFGGEGRAAGLDTFGRALRAPRSVERLAHKIEVADPDVLVVAGDLWFCCRLVTRLREYKPQMKRIVYAPVDGVPATPEMLEDLSACDLIATSSAFEERSLRVGFARLAPAMPRTAIFPLGVDRSTFYPLCGDLRRRVRAAMFGDERSFVVLNANEPHPRERLDLTIAGFAAFAREKPRNVRLCLRESAHRDGAEIRDVAARYGVAERMLYGYAGHARAESEDRELNRLYNACDVGLTTSAGEGPGLASLEHAAANRPQIVPKHGAYEELWSGAARFFEPTSAEATIAGVAAALEEVYGDPARRSDLTSAAYARAAQEQFDWDAVARTWAGSLALENCEAR